MTDTVVSNAIAFPHDEGLPNIVGGNETWHSAGLVGLLAEATRSTDSYIRNEEELAFVDHDAANDQVSLTSGSAFLNFGGESVSVQSDLGGDTPPAYDTTLPSPMTLLVVVPTKSGPFDVTAGSTNDMWLAYATSDAVGGITRGQVYIRHGSGLSSPPHPSVHLGETDPDDSSADVLLDRGPEITLAGSIYSDTQADPTTPGITNNDGDLKAYTGSGVKSLSDIGSAGGDSDHSDWNMVNVVAEGGADNTGATDSTAAIQSVVADNTLLVFPPGTYLVDAATITANNLDRIGFWAPSGATLTVTSSKAGSIIFQTGFDTSPTARATIEGFTFDFTDVDAGTRAISMGVTEYGLVRDCNVVGEDDAGSDGPLRVDALEPDAMVMVEGWHAPDGAQHAVNTPGDTSPTGFYVGNTHQGTVFADGCHVANYPDNGLYASGTATGTIIVRGGRYENNDISQVRLSTEGSQVIGVTAAMTAEKPDDSFLRGIWFRMAEGLQMENCKVIMGTPSSIGVVVDGDCPGASIRGGRIQNDVNGAHSIQAATLDVGVEPQPLVIDGVTLVGSGTGDGTSPEVMKINREDATIQNCYINMQPGGAVNRLGIRGWDGTVLRDCRITVDENAFYTSGGLDDVTIDNCQLNATTNACRIDGADWEFRGMLAGDIESFHVGDAVRPRWNGVIEGGPFFGVDVTTVTGQHEGDLVMSDGSTLGYPEGAIVSWDSGTSAWRTPVGQDVVAEGTIALSSGAATVSTGVTTTGTSLDVALDPSGDGANGVDVKASARAYWDGTEYKVEILEDGTTVGNPTIGYRVTV